VGRTVEYYHGGTEEQNRRGGSIKSKIDGAPIPDLMERSVFGEEDERFYRIIQRTPNINSEQTDAPGFPGREFASLCGW